MSAPTLRAQWAEHGNRPVVERWVSRVAMLIGLAIGAGVLLGAAALSALVARWIF